MSNDEVLSAATTTPSVMVTQAFDATMRYSGG